MTVELDTGIPVPKHTRNATAKYPWDEMVPHSSFHIEKDDKFKNANQHAQAVRRDAKKADLPTKALRIFATIEDDGDYFSVTDSRAEDYTGLRVWRVATLPGIDDG